MRRGQDILFRLGGKLDRVMLAFCGLGGGLLLAQFPQFLAQYLQRLGGHVDEARLAAREFALPALGDRAAQLAQGMSAIERAPALVKLPVFLVRGQWRIARETWRHFEPGLTFAAEELCYLAAGAILGILVYGGCKRLASLCRRALRRKKREAGSGPGAPAPRAG